MKEKEGMRERREKEKALDVTFFCNCIDRSVHYGNGGTQKSRCNIQPERAGKEESSGIRWSMNARRESGRPELSESSIDRDPFSRKGANFLFTGTGD